MKAVVVVGGPTAGGKSALALAAAEAFGGVVINADSMQVYRELRILTARPGPAEQARVPHRLYGVLPAAEACTAARWRELAMAEIDAAHRSNRLPIVVGGTGLYLRALLHGLAPVPRVPPAVRAAAAARYTSIGGPGFHAELARRDAAAARRIRPGDRQRLVRAWEVVEATGRTLAEWQAMPAERPAWPWAALVVAPPRAALYAACDARVEAMVAAGAVAEVAALDRLGLSSDLPAMKALGVPEFRAHLHRRMDLAQAIAAVRQSTRRYAKRQMTWFRHQMAAAARFEQEDGVARQAAALRYIEERLLTLSG